VDGEEGAFTVLEILRRELEEAMLLSGYSTTGEIDRSILGP
jgi:isopentenyl diphosphate isomerase/L-lactate dehydrogenase-like FMN-dependent dehydrogenase